MHFTPGKEHQWLQKFVGQWRFESEMVAGPGEAPITTAGTEAVRSLEGAWIIGEGRGSMTGGGEATMILTIGYDPALQRYVGTWIGSMMPVLWVYRGEVDAAGRKISLHAEGPRFDGPGTAEYIDAHEFVSDDHRVMTGSVRSENGQWNTFMTAHYYRVK